MNFPSSFLTVVGVLALTMTARAQHLTWDHEKQDDATCVYGEITVLATHENIYYCGVNWHPGEPAGGYCGIQHNSGSEHRTIFSIWDTSPTLHPKVTEADPQTIRERFGGEGTGGHTHMLWDWKVGETFQFFVTKQPGTAPDTTDARYYVFDRDTGKWRHSATINSPNGGHRSVGTISGGLNSFLENFSGQDKQAVKLALYRLWLGTSVNNLHCLTHARGDGTWGELHDAYFLAAGDPAGLKTLFENLEPKYGKPLFGAKGQELPPIPNAPLSADLLSALKNLPRAELVNK